MCHLFSIHISSSSDCHTHRFRIFLQGSGDHRYLHSFPTRRSSDLYRQLGLLSEQRGPPFLRERLRRGKEDLLLGCELVGDRDRKSTRLNSSHANISYAVFRLKKKIIVLYIIETT